MNATAASMTGRKCALITGASYGIGEDFARIFAREGFDLVLAARSAEKLSALARELSGAFGIRAETIAADLTKPDAAREIHKELERRGLRIDALVNNAGFGLHGEFVRLGCEEQLDIIRLNAVALTELTRFFLPGMIERRYGKILNVASTAAFQPGPLMAVYYATKAYVLSFSEAIHEEVRGTGVTVTCLCPGPTKSHFQQRAGMGKVLIFQYATMPSGPVAEAAFRAMMKGWPLVIPGLINKVTSFLTRLSPRAMVPPIVHFLQMNRGKHPGP